MYSRWRKNANIDTRSRNITSFEGVIIALRISTIHAGMAGTGTRTELISARMQLTSLAFWSMSLVSLALVSDPLSFDICIHTDQSPAGRSVPIAATRIYEMSFFTGFGVSALVYIVLNLLFPVPGKYSNFEEIDVSEGEKSHSGTTHDNYDDEDADSKKGGSGDQHVYPVWYPTKKGLNSNPPYGL